MKLQVISLNLLQSECSKIDFRNEFNFSDVHETRRPEVQLKVNMTPEFIKYLKEYIAI